MQKLKATTILIIFLFAFVCRASFAQTTRTLYLNLEDEKLPFGLTQKVPAGLPKIGLALSGGGARSFAQLGVLKALEEGNIPIDIITGTSMGSIIGGLYSAGYSIGELDSIIN
ncbi:patatin-like phospholipase family protein, partial [Bacteroidota bacterium]